MSSIEKDSDVELVEKCNTGRRGVAIPAFEALYARHKDYVLRVAYRYLDDAELALDVLQDTFSALLRQFPPAGSGLRLSANLRTYLYSIAKNNALSILRKNSRMSVAATDVDELPASVVDRHEIGNLLAGLSPGQREMVQLRFVDDLAMADIAALLEIPLGTAKSRLHAAIVELRKSPYVKEFFEK